MVEPAAAVAVIHRPDPQQRVLLMRRATDPRDHWAGQWALPGGRREAHDPDLAATARRETEEEMGITLPSQPDHALEPQWAGLDARHRILVAAFVWRLDVDPPVVPDEREVAAWRWMPCAQLARPETHPKRALNVHAPDHRQRYIPLAGTPLWGFTWRVLTDWWTRRDQEAQAG